MANYREILRLHSLGTSQRGIAWEVRSSRDTVADVIKAANAAGITWPLDEDITNGQVIPAACAVLMTSATVSRELRTSHAIPR